MDFVFSGRLELTYGSHKNGKFDFCEGVDFDYDQKLYDGIKYILASGRVKKKKMVNNVYFFTRQFLTTFMILTSHILWELI